MIEPRESDEGTSKTGLDAWVIEKDYRIVSAKVSQQIQ